MSSNTKHSKIRNTGILFELLTRQITVDVLNNNKKAQAAKILKEFFNKKTQLGREYEFYRVLTTENYKSETVEVAELEDGDNWYDRWRKDNL